MGGPDINTGSLSEGRKRVIVRDGPVAMEADIKVMQWRKEPQTEECGQFLEAGKGMETFSPTASRSNAALLKP